MEADFEIGGHWGDRLEWTEEPDWENLTEESVLHMAGWKTPHPKVGQTMKVEMQNSWMLFEFIEIKPCKDPRDMFFAKVKPIKQEMK